jgi:hypothetical protein
MRKYKKFWERIAYIPKYDTNRIENDRHTHIRTATWSHKPNLFFQNKESSLKKLIVQLGWVNYTLWAGVPVWFEGKEGGATSVRTKFTSSSLNSEIASKISMGYRRTWGITRAWRWSLQSKQDRLATTLNGGYLKEHHILKFCFLYWKLYIKINIYTSDWSNTSDIQTFIRTTPYWN